MESKVRLAALDAYRGVTMLFMASEMWRIPAIVKRLDGGAFWQWISFHFSHVAWEWGSAWDMIQPSFMFMVGVALPWSVARRREEGAPLGRLWLHALWRSLMLIALGIFLRSTSRPLTNFTFEDVLTQIGLGYPILFLAAWMRPRWQIVLALVLLIGYWGAFALYPAQGDTFASHWYKSDNAAAANDRWFMNLWPREKPFERNGGGYQTLSFVPSLGTMLLGLLAGGLLRSDRTDRDKLRILLIAGAALLAAGTLLGLTGICPVVKRIWTPSWTLFSGGWVLWILAAFYRFWPGGTAVEAVGKNPIAMYVMVHLWDRFLAESFQKHFRWNVFAWMTPETLATVSWLLTWALLWWICVWMDRKRLYIRI
jgi:heparan-alpha-glucosaminide N-acetyltransferase